LNGYDKERKISAESWLIERAPIEIKNEIDSWGSFGSAAELTKRVKYQLDPENVLSPGRF
jgi:hypothetical protein